ncbi:MAG: hypothetical protein ACD_22C00047G0004 [uncultured bacterium]|nr:MAG: hypothetical protein ACD_22C00047G0004 [uncultured bacterium]
MELSPKRGSKAKVVMYIRVSTVEQAELGHSLDVQLNRLSTFADQNGWQILKMFKDEGKSARTIDRPSFQELLDYCEDNNDSVDAVLVQDTSRLCRNAEDHLYVKSFLKKQGIRLISLEGNNDDTDEGQFLDLIIAGVNELESRRTGRKTKRIMIAMFEDGFKPGKARIGYINSFKKGVPMHIDPETKVFIQEIFRLWGTGNYSLAQISNTMYEKGFRSENNKKVNKSALQSILKCIDYAGGLEYDGKINYHAKHEAIITMEEFERTQQVFARRNKGADRSRKYQTLLAGVAHCFKCGSLMYGDYHKDGKYYKCLKCGKPYTRMDYIDGQISDFFKGSAFTEKGLARLKGVLLEVQKEQSIKSIPQQKAALEARKKALDKKMNKLEDKLLFGDSNGVAKERVQQKYEPLKEQMAQIDSQLAALDRPSNSLKTAEIDRIIWGMGRMGEVYEALDPSQRKQFLKFFIKKVYIDCSENKIKNYDLVEEFETLLSRDLVRISSNWLENRNSNITTQLACIFKTFEDFRLVRQIREEIEKVQQITSYPSMTIASPS